MSIIRDGIQSADLDAPVASPTLNLDFANSQELDPRITFTRGSIGTFVNKNGLIETAQANVPRFDYDPISGECRGLLIEESRSNYFHGTQLGNGGSVSDGTATGANGVTAKKFVPTLGNAVFPSIYNFTTYSFTAASGGTVDVSFSGYFAATGTGLYVPDIVIEFNTGGTSNFIYAELLVDLTNGTVWSKALNAGLGFSELIAPQITLMPFGMYKVTWSIRYTQGATIRDAVKFYIQCRRKNSPTGATGTYYADGVNGFQFSCIQYEIGAFPTSYIPTTTSAVTRTADNASMTGTNFSSWANTSSGTFLIRVRGGQSTSQTLRGRFIGIGLGGSIGLEGANTTIGIWDTTNAVSVTNSSADVVNRISNVVTSFDGNLRRVVLNGVQFSGTSRRNINTIFTQITLGSGWPGSNYLNGTLSRVTYYPRQLNDSQMLYLTQ